MTTNAQHTPEMVDLLTQAVADITAALVMGGNQAKVADWCRPYVEAINAHDAALATGEPK